MTFIMHIFVKYKCFEGKKSYCLFFFFGISLQLLQSLNRNICFFSNEREKKVDMSLNRMLTTFSEIMMSAGE